MTNFSQRIMDEYEDEPEELEFFAESGLTESPEDYYFAISHEGGERSVVITPRKLFDEESIWSDSDATHFLLEAHLDGYADLMESVFETPEDLSDDEVRAELSSRGFIEHTALLQV